MNFLLDTNVVSEWMKPRPDMGVIKWLAEADEDRVFLSVVTLAELRHGIERMPEGARRNRYDAWLTTELPRRFDSRVIHVDAETSDQWGRVVARGQSLGRPVGTMDAFLAATALRHDMTLLTRNISDFEVLSVRLLNPWSLES